MLPDYFKSIQILAAEAVKTGSPSYWERYMYRWYSKTFHVAIDHAMETMAFEDVLQAFYEDHYASLDEETFAKELKELLETPEERVARIQAEEDEEMQMATMAQDAERQNQKKLKDVVMPQKPVVLTPELKEAVIPEVPQNLKDLIKPDVEMKFVGDADIERLVESIDALKATVKKPQS